MRCLIRSQSCQPKLQGDYFWPPIDSSTFNSIPRTQILICILLPRFFMLNRLDETQTNWEKEETNKVKTGRQEEKRKKERKKEKWIEICSPGVECIQGQQFFWQITIKLNMDLNKIRIWKSVEANFQPFGRNNVVVVKSAGCLSNPVEHLTRNVGWGRSFHILSWWGGVQVLSPAIILLKMDISKPKPK